MRIGILGSGLMGGKLGTLFARAGHAVVFSYARTERKLKRLAREAGQRARAGTPADAARESDVLLLAVHWSRVDDVLKQAGDVQGRAVVSCSLPMNANDTDLVVAHSSSGAEVLAHRMRRAHFVAAFGTVPSDVLVGVFERRRRARRPSLLYCGDDQRAKDIAARLIRDVGFEPVDAGPLRIARYTEPFTLLIAQLAYEGDRGPAMAYRLEWMAKEWSGPATATRPRASTRTRRSRRQGSATLPHMIYRNLGRTGERVSAVGVGGWHLGLQHVDEDLAIRIVRTALDSGINFLDNCWDYNNGASEIRMGKALRDGYREKAFLMTKIDGRSKKEAARQLEESLRRLGVDHIDLVQHHEILRYEDPHRIFHEQGAHAALIEARGAGTIRYIGFTGHKDPHIHLYMLAVAAQHGFQFDAVQLPLNLFDAHFRSFSQLVVPELVRQGIGILGMKSMGNGVLLKSNTVTALECLHYALNLPTSVVITGIDSLAILEQALAAVRTFRPMSDRDLQPLLARTATAAAGGEFEPFKTTSLFDGTAQNPAWLGEEPPEMQELVSG